MLVHTIKCSSCLFEVYSRARHDFRWCPCGDVAIDGGFNYIKITGIPASHHRRRVKATKNELYADWNTGTNKYGHIAPSTKEAASATRRGY